jgi:hypothetical protein
MSSSGVMLYTFSARSLQAVCNKMAARPRCAGQSDSTAKYAESKDALIADISLRHLATHASYNQS